MCEDRHIETDVSEQMGGGVLFRVKRRRCAQEFVARASFARSWWQEAGTYDLPNLDARH